MFTSWTFEIAPNNDMEIIQLFVLTKMDFFSLCRMERINQYMFF